MKNIEVVPIETGQGCLLINESLQLEELDTKDLDMGEDLIKGILEVDAARVAVT